jgi:ABC-2 type transport system permease protein
MRPYLAVIAARFRLLFQYRAAAFAGICTQFFWGIMHVMVFTAFYAQASDPASLPMTLAQVVTYTWLVQAFLVLLPWNIDPDVQLMVRTGNVAYELIRPIDLYTLWFCRALSWRAGPALLRIVPLFLGAYLIGGLQLPPSMPSALWFGVSMLAALVLSTTITTVMMISLFWTISGNGTVRLMAGLVITLSGMQVPIPLFPDWSQPLLNALPFRGLIDTPFRIYLGHIPPENILGPLFHQIGWAVALLFLGRWLLLRVQRRLVVQGG